MFWAIELMWSLLWITLSLSFFSYSSLYKCISLSLCLFFFHFIRKRTHMVWANGWVNIVRARSIISIRYSIVFCLSLPNHHEKVFALKCYCARFVAAVTVTTAEVYEAPHMRTKASKRARQRHTRCIRSSNLHNLLWCRIVYGEHSQKKLDCACFRHFIYQKSCVVWAHAAWLVNRVNFLFLFSERKRNEQWNILASLRIELNSGSIKCKMIPYVLFFQHSYDYTECHM